jgi:hypothetical protein
MLAAATGTSFSGPVVITAQTGSDPSQVAFRIRLAPGAETRGFQLDDANGSPIVGAGPYGGLAVFGDRIGAMTGVFGARLVIDAGITVPALAYLSPANLGNYSTVNHHWVCMIGEPTDVLANLQNNNGAYIACQVGDRYSRVDVAASATGIEYVCTVAGTTEPGETAGRWHQLI